MKATRMAKKPGPKPQPDRVRSETIAFKCTPGFKEWLAGFAEAQRDIPSRLIDRALAAFAKEQGHKPPPPR